MFAKINIAQYTEFCSACNRILLAPYFNFDQIAIPWLHVIRPHQIFLDGYELIFRPQASTRWKRRIRNIASALRNLAKAFLNGGKPWSSVGQLPSKCDVLMVSHLLIDEFLAEEEDFYYGRAAGELAEQGLSTTIALINYTNTDPAILAGTYRQSRIPRVILAPVLGLAAEFKLYWRVNVAALKLWTIATSQSSDLDRRFIKHTALEAASGGTIFALRLGEQVKYLVSRLQPRAIIVTYEGHSWERIAFAAARSVFPQICCIGYQHAALFNLQHAIQRRLAANYNPDVILTSGRIAQVKLQWNPQLRGVRVEVIGSNRSFTRQAARTSLTINGEMRACLVLPEGNFNECNLLLAFALQCARLLPDIEFIWRLHPNMNFEALTRQNKVFYELLSNIFLSSHTLAEDIARSYWALYRGSTAIVQAVMSGLRPIFLTLPGEISIDPLFEIADLHANVIKPADFAKLAKQADHSSTEAISEQVQNYCEQMFTPMDAQVLTACITASR
ncbi:hypothetical protein [Synechococcus sp. UW140]|uniref:hypothetical protein n=1 Tax=Synechococcus sp. UW140 TaxID=368503 RepID=UPI003137BC99